MLVFLEELIKYNVILMQLRVYFKYCYYQEKSIINETLIFQYENKKILTIFFSKIFFYVILFN